MTIADVAWSRDIRGRPVLELKRDGHPAYIRSSQRTELTRRGLLDGMVFLRSERSSQVPGDHIAGNYAPDYEGLDLVGCTDDPEVFALYREMCAAIAADAWHEGPRPPRRVITTTDARGAAAGVRRDEGRGTPGRTVRGDRCMGGLGMATKQGYFDDLNRLLAAMPPGMLDLHQIEENERRHGHRFHDPPETVYRWLLDQQRRVQGG